jgi:hypothetical protein
MLQIMQKEKRNEEGTPHSEQVQQLLALAEMYEAF